MKKLKSKGKLKTYKSKQNLNHLIFMLKIEFQKSNGVVVVTIGTQTITFNSVTEVNYTVDDSVADAGGTTTDTAQA